MIGLLHSIHCVGGCSRIRSRDLSGMKPAEIRCSNCNSDKVAIWKDGYCVYAYNGQVDYPMGRDPFGTKVRGPK